MVVLSLPAALSAEKRAAPRTATIALLCLGLVVLLQLELLFSKSVNWDEFYHFSEIHQFRLGRWTPFLQTPYVYLFSWVPILPGDTISQIQIIRLLILPFELVTFGCIFLMARRLASRQVALLCVLLYATGGFVFLHAFALRADMIAAMLLSLALSLLLLGQCRLREMAACAVLLALATVATIKSVLWAPAFLAVLLFRLGPLEWRRSRRIGIALTACAIVVVALVAAVAPRAIVYALNSADWMFSAGFVPQGRYLLTQVLLAPILTAVIVCAPWAILRDRRPGRRMLLLGLFAPLLSVLFYRNAYPYFFVFILPPVVVALAPGIEVCLRRYAFVPASLLLLGNAAVLSLSEDRSVLTTQQEIQDGVREIFPAPVAYIDDSGMIGDFPRAVGRFASGWSLAESRRRGERVYTDALEREPVPLLIANTSALAEAFEPAGGDQRLLDYDVATLRSNYLRHWGDVYVAGKVIPPGASILDIKIPGPYTVEGGPIAVDGRTRSPGEVVLLPRGLSRANAPGPGGAILRWGDHLPRPRAPWPSGRLYTDF